VDVFPPLCCGDGCVFDLMNVLLGEAIGCEKKVKELHPFAKDFSKKANGASGGVSFDVLFDEDFMRKFTS
jgi:hypothetical protein